MSSDEGSSNKRPFETTTIEEQTTKERKYNSLEDVSSQRRNDSQQTLTTTTDSIVMTDQSPLNVIQQLPTNNNVAIPTLEELRLKDHAYILKLLHRTVLTEEDIDDYIKKEPISSPTTNTNNSKIKYPSNALKGSHLLSAINTYKRIKDEERAFEVMVNELMENNMVGDKFAAKLISDWLIATYMTNIQHSQELFMKYSPRSERKTLIHETALYFNYLTNEEFVNTINDNFDKLLVATDKQSVKIPFMACAPGSGKTRNLQEIFSKTKQGKEFKDNSIEILISFGNGTALLSYEQGFEKALCARILYNFLDIPLNFQQFLQEVWQHVIIYNFEHLLELIAKHWTSNNAKSGNLYIYLGIDEFTNLSKYEYLNNEQEKRTYLDGVINVIGNTIINLNKNNKQVRILPFFAGLDYKIFTASIAKSTFNCNYITPYKFTEDDEKSIVNQYFSAYRYNEHLWKVILFCNKHPRLLVWLIIYFSKDIQKTYNTISDTYTTTYGAADIPEIVAKWILSHVITQHLMETDLGTLIDKWTIKQLEENGWISLTKVEQKFKVTAPFPLLKTCVEKLTNLDEKQLFRDFLKRVEIASWEQQTHDRHFEIFNAVFDCVLNRCFIYLGFSFMDIKSRFRGAKFGEETNTNLTLRLESFPKKYSLQKVKFNESEKTNIPSQVMVVKGYSKLLSSSNTTTITDIQWLRDRVAEELKKEENRQELSIQITQMISENSFEGLGEEFVKNLKVIQSLEYDNNTFMTKIIDLYIENMKKDQVLGGDVELKLISRILNTCIQVITLTNVINFGESAKDEVITLALDANHYDLLVK